MAILRFLLVVTLVGLAVAGPLDRNSKCACGCDCSCMSFGQKLSFQPGKSYIYTYEGRSEVEIDGVEPQAKSQVSWEAEVALSWLNECKVAIGISKPAINGNSGDHILNELLASKPMVATIKNGVLTGVFPDKDDHPTGLNLKKGIISSIQNVLPELTSSITNKTFIEIDVLGRCPTTYTVQNLLVSWKVIKTKNHKDCSLQYEHASESAPRSWLMNVPKMPIVESKSQCEQVIRRHDNVTTSVHCRDENVINTASPKQLKATQESTLTLKKIVNGNVVPEVHPGKYKKDIAFEVLPQPKTKDVVPKVEKLLRQLSAGIDQNVTRESASHLAKMVGLLYRVPEDSFKTMLRDIRNGHYSPNPKSNPKRLESLFLDAMSFVGNAGAVQIMVEEVTSGKISGGRTAMYTLALHLMREPCVHSVEAVIPLFSSEHAKHISPAMTLAAGSLVRKYCRAHPDCLQEAPVKSILEKLTEALQSSCPSSSDSKEKAKALAALKTIGNIANITQTIEKAVLRCAQLQRADTYVRVAAAQAYRQASCHNQPTTQLMELALSSSVDTEVRIASYLAAIKCASYEQIEKLVLYISREANTQVRSFILSHLHILQRSDAPYLRELSYNLTSIIIPNDYERGLQKHSFSNDYSYYFSSLGLGGGIDTSVVFTPGSYLPRQLQSNITVDLFNNVINIGEFGIRIEALEDLMGSWFKEQFERGLGSKKPEVDAFVRIFGQEVVYILNTPDISKIDLVKLREQLQELAMKFMIEASSLSIDSARGFQANLEYFVPTVQGIPLQMKIVGTGVLALSMQSNIQFPEAQIQSVPSLSVDINSFIGYSFGVKTGLRTRMEALTVSNHSMYMKIDVEEEKYEAVYDIAQKADMFNATGHCYMMNKMPGREDQRTAPSKDYPGAHLRRCSSRLVESTTGLEVCLELSAPDLVRTNMFPLGDYKGLLTLEKRNPHKQLLKLTGQAKLEERAKRISTKLELPGSESPMKGEMGLELNTEKSFHSLKLYDKRPNGPKKMIQVDLKNVQMSEGRRLHMTAFYGKGEKVSRSDQVLILQFQSRRSADETERKLDFKTKKLISKYLKADIEVDIATKPREVDIKRFEVSVVLPKALNTTSFIRKNPSSNGSSRLQYHIQSSTRTPSWEMLSIDGKIDSKGEISRQNHESSFNFTVNASKQRFHYDSVFVWTREKKQALLGIKKEGAAHHSFLANASVSQEPSSSTYSTKAEIQIPSIMPTCALEGLIDQKTSKDYRLNLLAKKENRAVCQIEGPLNIDITSSKLEQKSDITIKQLDQSQEYTVGSELFLSGQKMAGKIDVKSNGAPIIAAEGEIKVRGDSLSSGASLSIPKVIDAKLTTEKAPSMLQLVANGYLKPNTQESQHVKAFAYLNTDKKEIKAKYDYDLDKDPKNLKLSALYDYNTEKLYASVKGNVQTPEDSYMYNAEGLLGSFAERCQDKNALKVELKKDETREEILIIECECKDLQSSGPASFKTLVKYSPESSQENTFKISSKFDLEVRKAPYQMSLNGEAKLDTQRLKETTLSVDLSVDSHERYQKAQSKIELSRADERNPVTKAHFDFENKQESLSAKLLLNVGSSSDLDINGELQMTKPESQAIGDGSLQFKVKIPRSDPYSLKASKDGAKSEISLKCADRPILAFEQSCPSEGKWTAKLITPSRVAEAHSQYTSDLVSVSLYPNRKKSEEKYELEGIYRRSSSISGSRLETKAHVKYPGRENGLGVRADAKMSESSSQGIIELHIFRDAQEKVVIDVQTSKLSEHSYKVQADFKIPAHNLVPRIDLNVTLSRDFKRLEMLVKKSPSSPPVLESALSFVRSTNRDSSFYARLQTPSQHFELISALQLHDLRQCRGASINGSLVSERHGSYDFASAVCAPGYIEFGVKDAADDKMFLAKLGMKNPASVKVALDLVFNSSKAITRETTRKVETTLNLYGRHEYLPKIPMLRVGAQLWSPKVVSVDVLYNVTGIREYAESVLEPSLRGAKHISKELLQNFNQNLQVNMPDISSWLIDELKHMRAQLCHELESLLEELGISFPGWDDIKEDIQNLCHKIIQKLKDILDDIDNIIKRLLNFELADIQRSLKAFDRSLQKYLREAVAELQHISKRGIEAVKEIPLWKTAVEWLECSPIFEWIKEKFEGLKEMLESELKTVKKCIIHCFNAIKDEIKAIIYDIEENPFLKKIIKWIESWFERDIEDGDETLVGSFVSQYYTIYMNKTYGLLRVQVPLRRPVASLPSALSSVGICLPSGKSPRWKKNALSDSSYEKDTQSYLLRAAIQERYMTTFKQGKIPICYSPCQILIAKVRGDEIFARKVNPQKTEVKVLQSNGMKFEMHLDGKNPPRVPILQNYQVKVLGETTITRISTEEVKVDLKGLILYAKNNIIRMEANSEEYPTMDGLLAIHGKPERQSSCKEAWDLFERFNVYRRCSIPRE